MKINTYVLSTAELDQSLIDKCMIHGVELDAVSYVQVEPSRDARLLDELEKMCALRLQAVFTSANAVTAISATLKKYKPVWDVFCIGQATRKAVLQHFDEVKIKGVANDGATLAELISKEGIKDVVFFCGDKRLDALPDYLYRHDIMVREIVVYKTRETPEVVKKHYSGIMFFSPNGVNSFFRVNTISPAVTLFAIGNTTGNALKAKVPNKVIICESPVKELLVNKVIEYYHK